MKLAIMQPYFFPYIGYFQLIASVDKFIVYDNVKYTKKGWINRNRMLLNGKDSMFSLPLQKDSDWLHINQRLLAYDFDRSKLVNQFKEVYRRSPHFSQTFPLLERVMLNKEDNLFRYLHKSIVETCLHLGIDTEIHLSSSIAIDHDLKAHDKVLALCKAIKADTYINAIGGTELYDKTIFKEGGIDLKFIKSKPFEYAQFEYGFVPWLSIIDVLMFNSVDTVRDCINSNFELI